jgi:excinuclease ABC subunit C
VAPPFEFAHNIDFSPENSDAILREIPAAQGVFALRGADPNAEPYLTRAADLRRRMRRLLAPPEMLDANGHPVLSKRLNLRERVASIAWTRTGSDFESTLTLYRASLAAFGPAEARRRLRLHTPYFLRVTMSHEHPRVYTTNRLSQRALAEAFGPFPSRAAADRYADAVLDLFQIRRCYEDLVPHPDHPGCVYGEMKKCMQPCKAVAAAGEPANPEACTPAQYEAESARIFAFFQTRGQSLLDEVATQREAASEAMDFEQAAALHKQWEKVRAASLLSDELVRPVVDLRAVVLQEAASPKPSNTSNTPPQESSMKRATNPGAPHLDSEMWASTEADAAVFLLDYGHLLGPARLSTFGVRAVREQTAVGSSLFAQPLMLSAIPLDEPTPEPRTNPVILSEGHSPQPKDPEDPSPAMGAGPLSTNYAIPAPLSATPTPFPPISSPMSSASPEDRARQTLTTLESQTATRASLDETCDALSLFRRWYYRPEKQRTGEVFLPNSDGEWPIRRILNGAARIVLGPPAPVSPVDREAAKALKTKILHAGREGVEREVPILPKRPRTRKAVTPADVLETPNE